MVHKQDTFFIKDIKLQKYFIYTFQKKKKKKRTKSNYYSQYLKANMNNRKKYMERNKT